MKMQILIVSLISVMVTSAQAANTAKRSTASKTDENKGLNCYLEFKANGSMMFHEASNGSGTWILGIKPTATLKSEVGGPTVTLEALESNKKDFFRIRITDKKNELLNAVSAWSKMQVVVPVDFKGSDSEDPPTYEQMRVTCEPTYLAG